jgi:hypothetical protein
MLWGMRGVWDGENVGKKWKYVRDGENVVEKLEKRKYVIGGEYWRERRINDEMKTRLNIKKMALSLVLECGTMMKENKNYKKK